MSSCTRILSELKDIAARGGIRCTCGSAEYGIQVHRDAVDLICRRCGGKLRLPPGRTRIWIGCAAR